MRDSAISTRLPRDYCVHCLLPCHTGRTAHSYCTRRVSAARAGRGQVALGNHIGLAMWDLLREPMLKTILASKRGGAA